MKFTKYSRWEGAGWDSISIEDLLDRLADFLLQSGFQSGYYGDWNDPDDSLEALRQEILRALSEEDLLSDEDWEELTDEDGSLDPQRVAQLLDRIIERLIEEGYITLNEQPGQPRQTQHAAKGGRAGKPVERSIKFEITDKGLDFLGYRTLKDLIASLGKSSFGRHDTNYLSTGVEATEASRQYEFGDSLNLAVTA